MKIFLFSILIFYFFGLLSDKEYVDKNAKKRINTEKIKKHYR